MSIDYSGDLCVFLAGLVVKCDLDSKEATGRYLEASSYTSLLFRPTYQR